MVIGDRLKNLRETKNMSQGEIEKRTGLLRSIRDIAKGLERAAATMRREVTRPGCFLLGGAD
jgi:hypothetical protein